MRKLALLLLSCSALAQMGPTKVRSLNNIQFAGSDCGAKIDAADKTLSASPGEIWVSNDCGSAIATPVTISPLHVLRFTQGGTYTLSAGITLSANSTLMGTPMAMAIINSGNRPLLTLQMADSVNLPFLVELRGAYATVQDVSLEGNKNKNPQAGSNLVVNNVHRAEISRVVSGNSNSHGVEIISTGIGNGAGSAKIFKLAVYQNAGDGLKCVGSADAMVSNSEFENNTQHGLELADCPTWRIELSDFGGNSLDGMYLHGSGGGLGSGAQIIIGNQFGNQYQNDLYIVGNTSTRNIITANSFFGSPNRDNSYSSIAIVDGGANVITDNMILAVRGHQNYGISLTETQRSKGLGNQVVGNQFFGSFSGAEYQSGQAAGGFGLQVVTSGGGTGSSLDIFDPASADPTPHKFLRTSSGRLQIVNSSFSRELFSVTDGGIYSDSAGFKHKRGVVGCSTAANAGATCTTTLTWNSAFADTNYTVSCTGEMVNSGVPVSGGITAKTADSVTFETVAGTAEAAQYRGIECIAAHD